MVQSSPVMSGDAASAAPSERRQLDEALATLRDRATEFARKPPAEKAALLRDCVDRLVDAAPAWVAEGCKAKGLDLDASGEEWLAGPLPVVRMARLYAESLSAIAAHGRPPLGRRLRTRQDGRLAVDVFPASAIERITFGGFSGHVLLAEGIDRDAAERRQATFYQHGGPEGGVSLVLGAGNVSSIPPTDAFTRMFIDGNVCIIKMSPVNEWVGPHLERALAPLITPGYLRIVYGGPDVGRYLVEHEGVDDVHITGSARTHDAIVWGPPGPERDQRMAEGRPLFEKPISSELGNVSPVAIVPYTYTDDELAFQARNVVSMVTNNASFNCNAAKVVITARGWAQRDAFLRLVAEGLAASPLRKAYYPGAFDRFDALVGDHDGVQLFGDRRGQMLPWALVRDLDPERADEPLFQVEPFCGIVSQTSVGSADPVEFLGAVTSFMNDRLWGTLNATLIVHPALEADPVVGQAVDRAITTLRYGTVAINHWPAVCFASGVFPWGGHESARLTDIQSGLGWVHNTYMLGGIDKSVLRGPLKMRPTPPWFSDNHKSRHLGPRLVSMDARPRWRKLPGMIARAL
jgi:aldehyde dehydrogenase (NAD(P)+)